MTKYLDTLNLFNCLVTEDVTAFPGDVYADLLDIGVVLDFVPSLTQTEVLRDECKPLNITTLFTREERETASLNHLLTKQFLHYFEVYGLGAPGLFDLEVSTGQIVSLRYVAGISVGGLQTMVQDLLYANAPIKDAAQLKRIIEAYGLDYDVNRIMNNEMRVALYRPGVDVFDDGDDAVRYMCYLATGEALLIKSKEVIAAVQKPLWSPSFLETHENILAQVFNRHKRLILAAKKSNTATVINRIARKSKKMHVPIKESIAKTFVHRALIGDVSTDVLGIISVRDKFKYLNLLAQKRLQSTVETFKIRNGKVFTRLDRGTYPVKAIDQLERVVLHSLIHDLRELKGQKILLDSNVNYGLPVSRKQTIGQLPFGTQVKVDGNEISSGMYWENEWGASDLDLSTIDMEGNRVGWGQYSGYRDREIIFSGDLTNARNGAMEFMTSRAKDYGIFVNIFSGEVGAEMELVVGSNGKDHWIKDTVIREKFKLDSKNTIIGFVKGKTFTVYAGRLNQNRVSGGENPVLNQSKVDFWTVQRLLDVVEVGYDVDREENVVYDHDLSYTSFSFDKVEDLLTVA